MCLLSMHLQLKTSHLRSKAAQSLLAPLQKLMDKAESSISVPYIMHDVSGLRCFTPLWPAGTC
jgi:hypothetical protein